MHPGIVNLKRIKLPTFFFVIYIILIPFESILIAHSSRNVSYATYAAIITSVAMLIHLIFKPKLAKLTKSVIPWVAYFIWAALSIYWSINPSETASAFGYFARFLLFFVVISSYPLNKTEIRVLRHTVVLSGVLVAISMIANLYYLGQLSTIIRATLYGNQSYGDPNHVAATMILPIAFLLTEALDSDGALKIWDTLALIIIFIAILMTGSRSTFLAIIAIIATFIYQYRPKAKKIKTIFSALFILSAAAVSLSLFKPELYARYVPTVDINEFSAGRTKLWTESLHFWSERPLTGYGYGSFKYLDLTSIDKYKAAHNIFIQTLVELGLPGLILLIFVMYSTLNFKSRSNFSRSTKAGVIGILVVSMFIHTLNYDYLWLGLIFAEIASREKEDT